MPVKERNPAGQIATNCAGQIAKINAGQIATNPAGQIAEKSCQSNSQKILLVK